MVVVMNFYTIYIVLRADGGGEGLDKCHQKVPNIIYFSKFTVKKFKKQGLGGGGEDLTKV